MGDFSLWYSSGIEMKKKLKIFTLKKRLDFRIVFSKNMFIFKAKEYQSEKSPIFHSQKSTKTAR